MKLSSITSASVAMLAAVSLAGELQAGEPIQKNESNIVEVEPVLPKTDFSFPGYIIGKNSCFIPAPKNDEQSPGAPALFV